MITVNSSTKALNAATLGHTVYVEVRDTSGDERHCYSFRRQRGMLQGLTRPGRWVAIGAIVAPTAASTARPVEWYPGVIPVLPEDAPEAADRGRQLAAVRNHGSRRAAMDHAEQWALTLGHTLTPWTILGADESIAYCATCTEEVYLVRQVGTLCDVVASTAFMAVCRCPYIPSIPEAAQLAATEAAIPAQLAYIRHHRDYTAARIHAEGYAASRGHSLTPWAAYSGMEDQAWCQYCSDECFLMGSSSTTACTFIPSTQFMGTCKRDCPYTPSPDWGGYGILPAATEAATEAAPAQLGYVSAMGYVAASAVVDSQSALVRHEGMAAGYLSLADDLENLLGGYVDVNDPEADPADRFGSEARVLMIQYAYLMAAKERRLALEAETALATGSN